MAQTVFVTGGTKNSGLAVCERFAKAGFQVALTSRSLSDAEKTAALLEEKYGIRAKGYALSLQDADEIAETVRKAREFFGSLDVLVTVAADLAIDLNCLDTTPSEFDRVMGVNIRGTFFLAQAAARIMKEENGGAIVFFSSVQGFRAVRGRVLYGASKGAVNNLVCSLAYELGEYGIRVNAVAPGAIHTDRWDAVSEEVWAERRRDYPLLEESYPEDIADAVFFLASKEARKITGTVLPVDAGTLACLEKFDGGIGKRE